MESDNLESAEQGKDIGKHKNTVPGASAKTEPPKKTLPSDMPSFGDILKNDNPAPQRPAANAKKEFIRKTIEKISDSSPQDRSAEVPSFDLGRQILAGQRKAAAMKRKSPQASTDSSKTGRLIQSIVASHTDFAFTAPASPHQRIIADIVAKEISLLSSAR